MTWEKWPTDEQGKPMALVSTCASEKIGLPQYSNVDIGPMTVTRFCRDDDDAIAAELNNTLKIVEGVLSQERDAVVEAVNSAKAGTALS